MRCKIYRTKRNNSATKRRCSMPHNQRWAHVFESGGYNFAAKREINFFWPPHLAYLREIWNRWSADFARNGICKERGWKLQEKKNARKGPQIRSRVN